MNRIACTITILAVALTAEAQPALAQYVGEFTAAHLIHQGKTTNAIAGSGRVIV